MRCSLFWACLWLLLFASLAVASAPATRPAGGGRVWEFTDYLHGTAEQIRDMLNREPDRLAALDKQSSQDMRTHEADLAADKANASARFKKSRRYAELHAVMLAAEAEMRQAESAGDRAKEIRARQRFALAKLDLTNAQQRAEAGDESVRLDQERLAEDRKAIASLRESLKKATEWRATLIDATRSTLAMPGPVGIGSEGIIGKVSIDRVIDANSVLVTFGAAEIVKRGAKAEEGILPVAMIVHPTKMILTGIPTNNLHAGQTAYVDRGFRVIESKEAGLHDVYVAEHVHSDADHLMELIATGKTVPDEKPGGKSP